MIVDFVGRRGTDFRGILMRLAVLGTTVSQHPLCSVFFRDAFVSARSCTSGHLVESKKDREKKN